MTLLHSFHLFTAHHVEQQRAQYTRADRSLKRTSGKRKLRDIKRRPPFERQRCTLSKRWVPPHLDTSCYRFGVHIKLGSHVLLPGLDMSLCKRKRGLGKAVLPHAPEHRTAIRHVVVYDNIGASRCLPARPSSTPEQEHIGSTRALLPCKLRQAFNCKLDVDVARYKVLSRCTSLLGECQDRPARP